MITHCPRISSAQTAIMSFPVICRQICRARHPWRVRLLALFLCKALHLGEYRKVHFQFWTWSSRDTRVPKDEVQHVEVLGPEDIAVTAPAVCAYVVSLWWRLPRLCFSLPTKLDQPNFTISIWLVTVLAPASWHVSVAKPWNDIAPAPTCHHQSHAE
jgi:hypothetical protein